MANLNTHFEFFDSLFSYAFALFCIAGTLSLHFQTTPCTKSPKYTSDTRQTDGKIMPIKAVFEKERGILKQVV